MASSLFLLSMADNHPVTDTLLNVSEHSRDSTGMSYVYPVVSRRAGGVSVGINLNPNNACNWRCIYCQVPDLSRGGPPPLDAALLQRELTSLLDDILDGDFLHRRVPASSRKLMDVAFSGNGEPTSSPEFAQAVQIVLAILQSRGLQGQLPVRLITNGSLLDRENVQAGIAAMGRAGGEVWFKVDGGRDEDFQRVNSTRVVPAQQLARLKVCASLCPTWVQSCFFAMDGEPPSDDSINAYLDFLTSAGSGLRGVHLYGLARPSLQVEAARLSPLPLSWFEVLAGRLKEKGLMVTINP